MGQNNKKVIIFDGSCTLCSSAISFIQKRDKEKRFLFIPCQSKKAGEFLENKKYGIPLNKSVFLFTKNNMFNKSTAIIYILNDLGSIWKISICLLIIPKKIRDSIYDIIAKKRHIWFGKRNSCVLTGS